MNTTSIDRDVTSAFTNPVTQTVTYPVTDPVTTMADTTAATVSQTEMVMWRLEYGLPHSVWTAFEVGHMILTVLALSTNCLSLGVTYGLLQRLTPPLQLLTSLAFTDMLAPLAVMTLYFPESTCQDEIHSSLLLTAHNAGAVTLLALSFIHNIATFRPLHYERIVTQKRIWVGVALIWVAAVLLANVHFMVTAAHFRYHGSVFYCTHVRENLKISLVLATALCAVTAFTTAVIYSRILSHLRPIEGLVGENGEPRKSTRGAITGVMLASSFVLGWAPFLISKFLHLGHITDPPESVMLALHACMAIVLIRALLDPVIYGSRMINMELGYLRLYHRVRDYVAGGWRRLTNKHDRDDLPSTPLNPIESIC